MLYCSERLTSLKWDCIEEKQDVPVIIECMKAHYKVLAAKHSVMANIAKNTESAVNYGIMSTRYRVDSLFKFLEAEQIMESGGYKGAIRIT